MPSNNHHRPLPLIATTLVILLSLPQLITTARNVCPAITKSCDCHELNQGYEIECGQLLTIKYDDFNRYIGITCQCTLYPSSFIINDPQLDTNVCDPLQRLSGVTIPEVDKMKINYCDATNASHRIQIAIAQAKPTILQFDQHSFPNNRLHLQHEARPDLTDILRNIIELEVQYSELSEISYEMLQDMPALRDLYMNGNNIEEVTGQFSPNLTQLDLSINNISQISPNAFKGLKQLLGLMLFHNQISSLDVHIFDDLGALNLLELMNNRLEKIEPGTFSKLVNLTSINLSGNKLTALDEDVFWHNTQLMSIRLARNKFEMLPEGIFSRNSELMNLDLESNQLMDLPIEIFKGLTKLTSLNIANNRLTKIPRGMFDSLQSLETLKLAENRITSIHYLAFEGVTKLITLDISYNNLTLLHEVTFFNAGGMKTLNLANNTIVIPEEDETSFLNPLLQLEEVDLSNNRLTYIPADFMATKVNLKKLNMDGNLMTSFQFENLYNSVSNVTLSLINNKITEITGMSETETFERHSSEYFQLKRLVIANNPFRCDAKSYDLYRYFNLQMDPTFLSRYEIPSEGVTCATPEERAGQTISERNPCTFMYDIRKCPSQCECYHVPIDNKVIVDCSAKNLEAVPELFVPHDERFDEIRQDCHVKSPSYAVEVILTKNRIKYLQPISFVNINVTILDVSFNNLSAFTWIPHGLQSLRLDHNDLRRINDTLLENLNNVTLNNNPWICDCETENFWNFLSKFDKVPNKTEVKCNGSNKAIRSLPLDFLCPNNSKLIIIFVFVGAILVIIPAIALALYYKYKQEIKVWLFAHNMCMWFVREEDLDKDKIYDAFISFSQTDEDFVTNHLMPNLEQIPDPYKLCVHMRNFIPGEFIAKQVADSVLNSRRTLVVLSPAFLDSVWGKMEFRAAHTKAISEGVARVIIILYDNLDPNDERIDEELRVYLKTNTYIRWGDPWFWDKLKYALPHRKCLNNAAYVNKRFESISVNLDKLDRINQNTPANVINAMNGSANPPVDPLLLKAHPLDIHGRCVSNNTPPAEKGIV